MAPYYDRDGITIYHGDCREVMPSLGRVFDLVLTDPPYGMEFQSAHRMKKHAKIAGDNALDVPTIAQAIGMADRAAYVFCRWDNLAEMPKPRSVIAWVKNNWSMGDLLHEHGRQWEACCFYPGDNHEFVKRIPDVVFADRTGNVRHPTEKPLEVVKALMVANVWDTAFDPFMGSGTTLRAAKDLGRQAVGIELEERYCEIAAKRMEQQVFDFAD